jgi:hypothetical protein
MVMSTVVKDRQTADLDDREGLVVFLIGMRINRLWQFWRWLPVLGAMPRMLTELIRDPSRGLLGRPRTFVSGRVVMVVQYWRSFEDLERYARDPKAQHLPAWRAFNRRVRDNSAVGIFHETYRVAASEAESVYVNMPVFGPPPSDWGCLHWVHPDERSHRENRCAAGSSRCHELVRVDRQGLRRRRPLCGCGGP